MCGAKGQSPRNFDRNFLWAKSCWTQLTSSHGTEGLLPRLVTYSHKAVRTVNSRSGTSASGCKSGCWHWHIPTLCHYTVKTKSQLQRHPLISQLPQGPDSCLLVKPTVHWLCVFRQSWLFIHNVSSGGTDHPISFQQKLFCCTGSFGKWHSWLQPHEQTTSTTWTLNVTTTTNFEERKSMQGVASPHINKGTHPSPQDSNLCAIPTLSRQLQPSLSDFQVFLRG